MSSTEASGFRRVSASARSRRRGAAGPFALMVATLVVTASCGLQSGCAQRVAEQLGLSIDSEPELSDTPGSDETQAPGRTGPSEPEVLAWREAWLKLQPRLRTGDLVVWGPDSELQPATATSGKRRRRGIVPVQDIEERVSGLHDFSGVALLIVEFENGVVPAPRWPAKGSSDDESADASAELMPSSVELVGLVDGVVARMPVETWWRNSDAGTLRVYGRRPGDRPLPAEFDIRLERYVERFVGRPADSILAWDDRELYAAELVWKLWQLAAGEDLGQPTAWRLGTTAAQDLIALDQKRSESARGAELSPVITRRDIMASGHWQRIEVDTPAVASQTGELQGTAGRLGPSKWQKSRVSG